MTASQWGRFLRPLLFAGALAFPSPPAAAQLPPSLSFLGFAAGDSLAVIDRRLHAAGERRLSCRTSRRDATLQECRGRLKHAGEPHVELWLAAIEGTSGILMLSAPVDSGTLTRWRDTLVAQYGPVGVRVQGTQSMMQWVHRGRMLRLTWRLLAGDTVASVSLVDGHVLDAWGGGRRKAPAQ